LPKASPTLDEMPPAAALPLALSDPPSLPPEPPA